nr:PEP-CTERM sorting domain-containing protein [Microcystis sp. LEGE 08355]
MDVSSSTPTLAQLQAYDAVLSFSDYGFADTTTFGNVLADYVDAGGGVVQATFSFYNGYDLDIGGRWKAQNYNVWQLGQQNNPGNLTLGTIYDPSNPILAGVTSFNGGSASFYNTVGSFNPGAVAVADWSNGAPLIAVNTSTFAGKIAGLNFYPPSSDARPDFWLSSTDGARLMANSLNFVTKQVPEPNSLLGLFAIGTLGAASTLKRKLKPSKSTEKQTTKVG